jgi:protein O-mannosyl-transferase
VNDRTEQKESSAAKVVVNRLSQARVIGAALILSAIVIWTFLPSLDNGFIEFDESAYVEQLFTQGGLTTSNVARAFTEPVAANWHPLTVLSHLLDCSLYGLEPAGHHLTNLFLHTLNSVLLFLLLRQWTRSTWCGLLASALFALHPLRVESVAWISERKDLLSGLFWILTLWAYGKYTYCMRKAPEHQPAAHLANAFRSSFYWLALLLFALGLMSKPVMVTLPFVLLLVDVWPLDRWKAIPWKSLATEKLPFLILAAVLSLITFFVQRSGGMMTEMAGIPVEGRILNAMVSYTRYLRKLLWPVDLCALYPHPGHWPTGVALGAAFTLAAIFSIVMLLRRRTVAPTIGLLWFLGTLVPMIGIVQVGPQSIADRYTYIPSIGVVIAVVFGLMEAVRSRKLQQVLMGAGIIAAMSCIAITRYQIGFWKDDVSVWSRAIEVTQNNFSAHYRLARALGRHGNVDAAIPEYNRAVEIKPDFAEGHCSLGKALALAGRLTEAAAHFRRTLQLQPGHIVAENNLGNLLLRQGKADEALNLFQDALKREPNNPATHANLGYAFLKTGNIDEALRHLQAAVRIQPDNTAAQNNLGWLLSQRGQTDEAIACFQTVLKFEPGSAEAHNNLAGALLAKGETERAIGEFKAAAELQSDSPEIHRNLGFALHRAGRLDEAIAQFQLALKLNPNYAEARAELESTLRLKAERQTSPAAPAR